MDYVKTDFLYLNGELTRNKTLLSVPRSRLELSVDMSRSLIEFKYPVGPKLSIFELFETSAQTYYSDRKFPFRK